MGKYLSVFQAKDAVIVWCAQENLLISYKRKKRYFLRHSSSSDGPGLLRVQVKASMACYISFSCQGHLNMVTQYWVSGNPSIDGNERVDALSNSAQCPKS